MQDLHVPTIFYPTGPVGHVQALLEMFRHTPNGTLGVCLACPDCYSFKVSSNCVTSPQSPRPQGEGLCNPASLYPGEEEVGGWLVSCRMGEQPCKRGIYPRSILSLVYKVADLDLLCALVWALANQRDCSKLKMLDYLIDGLPLLPLPLRLPA